VKRLAMVLGVGLAAGACATGQAASTPAARQTLAAPYVARAQVAETDGRLRDALESRQVALTIDPTDTAQRAALASLQARIDSQVAGHLKEGRAALSRGAHVAARRHFLAALALDPGNRAAFEALRDQTQDVDLLSHTVRAGDTLAGLASQYYGNRALSEVIAETNKLQPGARLAPGTVLRIPEVPGVALNRPGARPPAPRDAPPSALPAAPAQPAPRDEPAEVNPIIAEAREAIDRQDYAQALADIDQLLTSTPRNPEALALKKSVLYSQGKAQFEQRKYGDSLATLTQLAKIAPNYEDSTALIRQTRSRLVEEHYNSGIRFYREEKLPEAITEWKTVLEIDPQHANARKNLEQAELLLKRLDERRK
jgi:tetratricopeptide (TPR) repeat protein